VKTRATIIIIIIIIEPLWISLFPPGSHHQISLIHMSSDHSGAMEDLGGGCFEAFCMIIRRAAGQLAYPARVEVWAFGRHRLPVGYHDSWGTPEGEGKR